MDGNEKLLLFFIYPPSLIFFIILIVFRLSGRRVKCAPIHVRMEVGVPNALNVVPVTTMPVVITLTDRATVCPAIGAIK